MCKVEWTPAGCTITETRTMKIKQDNTESDARSQQSFSCLAKLSCIDSFGVNWRKVDFKTMLTLSEQSESR
jgi:hypothetical protein